MIPKNLGIDVVIDEGTGEHYEQLKIGEEINMQETCDVCKRKLEMPTIMQFNFKTYMGHLHCMKSLREKLKGKR